MDNKEAVFFSGRLHGAYRCRKNRTFAGKVPKLEREAPDAADLILSGIANFGCDVDKIRQTAADAGCGEAVIPYDRLGYAKRRFAADTVTAVLTGKTDEPVERLVRTFYSFVQTPTPVTKELMIKSDVRDISRYVSCETRVPEVIGHPIVNIAGAGFVAEIDFAFKGTEEVVTGKRKVKGKYVYDKQIMYAAEAVRVFPGKPQVSEGSKLEDTAVTKRLEMYVMLKAAEKQFCDYYCGIDPDRVLIRASYYYLEKNKEKDSNFSPDFFGKGGNVVSLQTTLSGMKEIDEMFLPQIRTFLNGQEADEDLCRNCRYKMLCGYKEADVPISGEEKLLQEQPPELSPSQKEAVETLSGNVRVIATAGSGKTTVMAYRIMNLLKAGADPSKIGCFTFTNAASAEMADRIRGYCRTAGIEADVDKITISTIHSFGDHLIKQYYKLLGYKRPPVLINDVQNTGIIEDILSQNPPVKGFEDQYRNFYMDMYKAKGMLALVKDYFAAVEEGISLGDFMRKFSMGADSAKEIGRLYNQYVRHKKAACLVDHHDQEYGVLDLLKVKSNLFEEVGIEHISVDEYQDTSDIQFRIIDAMRRAKGVRSLLVVGDDDQSIYGFRNADVALLRDFPELIGDRVTDISLLENRRSTSEIVAFANSVISNNGDRISKNPVSVKGSGVPVTVKAFDDKSSEQEYVVSEIAKLVMSGRKDSDIAVLTPTNAELPEYEEMLADMGIRTISINPVPVLENSNVYAAVSLAGFMRTESEISGMIYLNALSRGTFVNLPAEEIKEGVEKLKAEMSSVKAVQPFLDKAYALDPDAKDEIFQKFMDDLKDIKKSSIETDNLPDLISYLLDYERYGEKETERKELPYNGVVLSTMHSAKGLEWPVVFASVTKLHGKEMEEKDVPEKNRLLYVACTRAREELYVTGVKEVSKKDGIANYFLAECEKIAS